MNARRIFRRFALAGAVAASFVALAVPVASAATDESADVGVTVTADKATYKVGDLVTYTVTVKDYSGTDASGVKLTDVLPAGLELVSATESPATDEDAAS